MRFKVTRKGYQTPNSVTRKLSRFECVAEYHNLGQHDWIWDNCVGLCLRKEWTKLNWDCHLSTACTAKSDLKIHPKYKVSKYMCTMKYDLVHTVSLTLWFCCKLIGSPMQMVSPDNLCATLQTSCIYNMSCLVPIAIIGLPQYMYAY